MRKITLVLPFAAAALQAQTVRGTVTDAGGVRVPGVVIQLLGASDSVVSRALSDANGAFLVATPRPGEYRVRTLRIGFKAITSEPITLAAGQEVNRQFELAGVAVTLSDVRIESESGCRRTSADSSGAAFAAWEQLRTALTATQITALSRGMTVTTIEYSRELDAAAKKVLSDHATVRTAQVRQPWAERNPELNRRQGYVGEDVAGNVTYHVPGLEALGSNGFLEDHCLRVSPLSDAKRLYIAFEPTPERREQAEVRGTAELDRATSELREVSFSYVNLPGLRGEGAGGKLEFTRMRDGTWVISSWNVRMPEVEQVSKTAAMGGVQYKVASMRENGAELTVARHGGDTLWTRAPLPLEGTVIDSATNRPVAGAVASLAGTTWSDTSDARGRFTIRAVPGEYTLEIRTPSLDSVKAVHQTKVAFIDSTVMYDAKVPNAEFVRRGMNVRNSAGFAGQVLADSTDQPLRDVEIAIPSLSKSAKTDSAGNFRISDVPAGVHRVVARRVGFGVYDAPTYFMAGHLVQRKILLPRVTQLATVSVTAEAGAVLPASFEENRKLGLGNFVTREMLERTEGLHLQTTLGNVPGLGLVVGRQRQAWIKSSRRPPPVNVCRVGRGSSMEARTNNIYCPEPFELMKGMQSACYAQVYLDEMLLNPGSPTEPFDINSIQASQVEAIEYYAGPAQTPAKYSRLNSPCGVLVIHTRR